MGSIISWCQPHGLINKLTVVCAHIMVSSISCVSIIVYSLMYLCLPMGYLRAGGVYSFFMGLAPDNIFFHTGMVKAGCISCAPQSSTSPRFLCSRQNLWMYLQAALTRIRGAGARKALACLTRLARLKRFTKKAFSQEVRLLACS
jgi:hypothetical protein